MIHLLHQVHLQIRSVSPEFDLIAWLYPPNATNKRFINLCYGYDQCQEDYRVELAVLHLKNRVIDFNCQIQSEERTTLVSIAIVEVHKKSLNSGFTKEQ